MSIDLKSSKSSQEIHLKQPEAILSNSPGFQEQFSNIV